MLLAADMDAQQMKGKLVEDVKEAWAASGAEEKNPVKSQELKKRWKQAEKRLHSFRMQQVAGGKDPDQAAQISPAWRVAAGVLSRALPSGLAQALKPGHAGDICTCSVHPTRAAQMS